MSRDGSWTKNFVLDVPQVTEEVYQAISKFATPSDGVLMLYLLSCVVRHQDDYHLEYRMVRDIRATTRPHKETRAAIRKFAASQHLKCHRHSLTYNVTQALHLCDVEYYVGAISDVWEKILACAVRRYVQEYYPAEYAEFVL